MYSTEIKCFSAIAFVIILVVIQYLSLLPPSVKPETAPANEFSAVRAYNILASLLKENKPHPTGSKQNKQVKIRIQETLSAINIQSSIQQTWACASKHNTCALVENIIAEIPGRTTKPALVIMAHYDSVRMSPGAGDNGAGVAALLETARALALQAPYDRAIILLFTDAEEVGLIGAEAFFNQHELAKNVGIVLNFEGTGTQGPSQVLRTSTANQLIIQTLGRATSSPTGFSLTNEIFKHMPNDTDFSVVQRANIPGIDFAFAAERSHYHSPQDNLENINLATIQHHGENMLPLVQSLANADLKNLGPRVTYGSVYGVWLQWPLSWNPILLLICLVALVFAATKTNLSLKGTMLGMMSSLLIILVSFPACYLAFKIIEQAHGTVVSWPAFDLSYRSTLIFSGLSAALFVAWRMFRYSKKNELLIGAWIMWLGLATVLTYYLPDAANMLLIPALAASLVLASQHLINKKFRDYWLLLTLVATVPLTLGVLWLLEESQGYRLILATVPFLALFCSALMPLLYGFTAGKALLVALALTTISIIGATTSPLYSAQRPQQLNIHFYEDIDNKTAFYHLSSPNPLPKHFAQLMDFKTSETKTIPYADVELNYWAETDISNAPAPGLELVSTKQTQHARQVILRLRSTRHADFISLVLPASAKLQTFELGGIKFPARLINQGFYQGKYLIRLMGVYDQEIILGLTLNSTETVPAFLYDSSTNLPETADQLLEQRPPLAAPVHRGDQAVLFRKVTI